MIIEIYGKDACPFCDSAKRKAETLCSEGESSYTYKKLDVDFSREELKSQFPFARTFPQIIVDGVSIGGWEQFKQI
tara:strand:+ start:3658 stop:3885 length:228 start_codon:yes stop_codon:yes gene_type:complete